MAKYKRHQAAASAKQVRWATEVKRRPQRTAIAFLRPLQSIQDDVIDGHAHEPFVCPVIPPPALLRLALALAGGGR